MKKLSILFFTFYAFIAQGQISNSDSLFLELETQDSIFFERGFNNCDIEYLRKHLTADLKFYHDQSGFQDRRIFFENTQKYICNGNPKKPIRKLKDGSLEVFPLYNNGELYGAIQHGIHHFYLREEGKEDLYTSTAKFTTVWIKEDGLWKMSNVLSYDHHNAQSDH